MCGGGIACGTAGGEMVGYCRNPVRKAGFAGDDSTDSLENGWLLGWEMVTVSYTKAVGFTGDRVDDGKVRL